jgi:hypothetical protein
VLGQVRLCCANTGRVLVAAHVRCCSNRGAPNSRTLTCTCLWGSCGGCASALGFDREVWDLVVHKVLRVCADTGSRHAFVVRAKVVARVHRRCDSFQHTTGAVAAANSESAASQLHTPARTSAASLGTAPAAASGSRGVVCAPTMGAVHKDRRCHDCDRLFERLHDRAGGCTAQNMKRNAALPLAQPSPQLECGQSRTLTLWPV